MAGDQSAIWDVIDEFKQKVKEQEAQLRRRREEVEALDVRVKAQAAELEQFRLRIEAKDKEVQRREDDINPREVESNRRLQQAIAMETDLVSREEEMRSRLVIMDQRMAAVNEREQALSMLLETATSYEDGIRQSMAKSVKIEEAVLAEEREMRRVLDMNLAKRDELIAKMNWLETQSALLDESRRLMSEQQRHLSNWEHTLNDREADINSRPVRPAAGRYEPENRPPVIVSDHRALAKPEPAPPLEAPAEVEPSSEPPALRSSDGAQRSVAIKRIIRRKSE
ncbi:MAG: hypothetical protein WCK39_07955 [Methanomassiliicoccales archaeon]